MKLRDEFESVCLTRFMRRSTFNSYWDCSRRFIRWAGAKSKDDLKRDHDNRVAHFLTHEAKRGVAAGTQAQTLNALVFLYDAVLKTPLGKLPEFQRPTRRQTMPEVPATHAEMMKLIDALNPSMMNLIGRLLYGCALRVNDALRIRLRDLDFANDEITIRGSKGDKDRIVPLPDALREELKSIVALREAQHLIEKRDGKGWVHLPGLYGKKNPSAHYASEWQYLFAAESYSRDPVTNNSGRHHITAEAVQQAFRRACAVLRLRRRVTPHGCRHAAARELERRGESLAAIQALLGHSQIETTLRYLGAGRKVPKTISPLD
jgi:integrase